MSGFNDFAPYQPKYGIFLVRNVAIEPKTIHIFNYPIFHKKTRDILSIPGVSESDIRASLLKGTLRHKLLAKDIIIEQSDIDLLQFNLDQKAFLQNAGIVNGLEVTAMSIGALTASQHETLRQLIHLADGGGPMEGFSGSFRETLPLDNPFPQQIIWWDSPFKLKKIIEKQLTYDSNKRIISIIFKAYDINGVLLTVITDIISYNGTSPFESTRIRTAS